MRIAVGETHGKGSSDSYPEGVEYEISALSYPIPSGSDSASSRLVMLVVLLLEFEGSGKTSLAANKLKQ